MFRSLGLFREIRCPNQHDCTLQSCIFNHETASHENGLNNSKLYDPFAIADDEPTPPPSKRRRLEPLEADLKPTVMTERPLKSPNFVHSTKPNSTLAEERTSKSQESSQATVSNLKASILRPISPPPKQRPIPPVPGRSTAPSKVEKLIPRPVAKAPATIKTRLSLVELLYKQLNILNSQIPSEMTGSENIILTDQQIIKWVLDEEEEAATKLASDIYRNTVSQKVLQFKRMKIDDWQKLVQTRLNKPTVGNEKSVDTSSELSHEQERQILRYLRTNLTGLDSHGYVTKPPSSTDIQQAKATIKVSGGYEVCDRCGTRFQVFPGRDAQGRLTTKGECHYHWAKLNRGQWQKTDHITGQAQSGYPCCGQMPGSEGCTQAATHVFKVSDTKRLAALLQFEQTPVNESGKKHVPVAFDCEMAYTTYGLEVVRVTAVSWPQNQELLDVLVRPFGEILDLNTRFSGVTQEQYTDSVRYDTAESSAQDASAGAGKLDRLRKVDSPAVARQLLFELLGPDTPLIGHAIDNDLNACRIIHPFVIDTVLLYPHPRGLPIRYGLKMLASKHLSRNIQNGGAAGHDSKEDSIATGDLVRVKVLEKWQMMRLQGWKFENESLVPPSR